MHRIRKMQFGYPQKFWSLWLVECLNIFYDVKSHKVRRLCSAGSESASGYVVLEDERPRSRTSENVQEGS